MINRPRTHSLGLLAYIYLRHGKNSQEDIFAGRYFCENIFSREVIFAGRYFRVNSISIFLFFPLSGVRCCLQLFHRLICYSSPPSSVSCLLLPVSLLSCLLHISLYTVLPSQYWPPDRLLLPCSRSSATLFGSLSSAILSTCPAHCNLLLTSLSVKLHFTPVSSLNTILRMSALVTLAICRTQLFAACVVVVRSEPRFPFRTGMLVWHKCSWPCPSVFLRIFAKIFSRNISNSLFAKFSSRENKVLYSSLLLFSLWFGRGWKACHLIRYIYIIWRSIYYVAVSKEFGHQQRKSKAALQPELGSLLWRCRRSRIELLCSRRIIMEGLDHTCTLGVQHIFA